MKTIKNKVMSIILIAITISILSSCQKEYNPRSFEPAKPVPTFDGYTSSGDIAKSNLIAYWAFNNSLVDSISNISGTATGTSFGAGLLGQSLQGANNGYVVSSLPPKVLAMTSFTISLWFNSAQNTNGIVGLFDISKKDDFWGGLTIFLENGSTATSGNLKIHTKSGTNEVWMGSYNLDNPWNRWTNVVLTYDETSSTFTVYADNQKVGGSSAGNGPFQVTNPNGMVFGTVQFQTTPPLNTGGTTQPWASYLTGREDEVRVYNKALSVTDLDALYNLEKLGH